MIFADYQPMAWSNTVALVAFFAMIAFIVWRNTRKER